MNSKLKNYNSIEILDTTLRDGEQTPGVSFSPQEKLDIARFLLARLHVDRLEIASAGVSDSEAAAVREIVRWAEHHNFADALEILGFIDGGKSVRWIRNTGANTVNFLAKGSPEHCRMQVRKAPRKHIDDIVREITDAAASGMNILIRRRSEPCENRENDSLLSFAKLFGIISLKRKIITVLRTEHITENSNDARYSSDFSKRSRKISVAKMVKTVAPAILVTLFPIKSVVKAFSNLFSMERTPFALFLPSSAKDLILILFTAENEVSVAAK